MGAEAIERNRATQAELVEQLSRPEAYAHRPGSVELVETHISLVFLAGDRVYKVKKALDLGFLDYSTLERRRLCCEEEIRLNERLAPGVYLGVVPITREADGSLRVAGQGPSVEVAVEMRRLPAQRMLDRLLAAGEIDNEQMDALAELLARFHGRSATGPGIDEFGALAAVAFNTRENFEQTEPFVARPGGIGPAGIRTVSPELHAFLREASERFLERESALLDKRLREGCIRDGHGDLHAGNVCLTDAGILVYDCIEFAPRFRCGDVACDLAFLAMDLDYRGFRGFARYLVRRYAEHARDRDLEKLVGFYKGYRAVVRAKVASIGAASAGLPPESRENRRLEAMRYFHLAAAYELPPVLMLTCGLPASGKTTAARFLAAPFEALSLRSDTRRKLLGGVPPSMHASAEFGQGIYTPGMTEQTYRALLDDADPALRSGRSVVVDASFSRAAQRASFAELARSLGAPFLVVETTASEETIRERMALRARDPHEASDADIGVYLGMRDTYEAPSELHDRHVLHAPAGEPAEETTARAIDKLVSQALA
jgi:aminoglycoside phosphotransferase family enzyme/predicted kinase